MRFLKIILIAGTVLFACAGIGLAVLLDDRATVTSRGLPDAESAKRARSLLTFVKYSLRRSDRTYVLHIPERDLNGLIAFVGRGLAPIDGRAEVAKDKVAVLATLSLPKTPLGTYLNAEFAVQPSSEGLRVAGLKVGPFDIPGWVARPLLIFAADRIVGAEVGGMLAAAVKSVETRGSLLRVAYRFEGDSVAVMKSRVKSAIRQAAPLGDADLVRVYYARLAEVGLRDTSRWDGPVGRYLTPLFALARERSADGDPAAENQAAILALAMYCGNLAFENLIGDVRQGSLRRHWPRCRRNTLAGRHDLMLHFVYSAALKIAADSGLAFAAGEFKEVLDSARGGSGFSFADLAADRAGIKFAETALDSNGGARRLQRVLGNGSDESTHFPDLAGLAEGLSEDAFKRAYRSLDDPAYRAVIEDLDARIARLPAYRTGE